jgi:RNA polymerase sigma-70 factor (ECF subfamily)
MLELRVRSQNGSSRSLLISCRGQRFGASNKLGAGLQLYSVYLLPHIDRTALFQTVAWQFRQRGNISIQQSSMTSPQEVTRLLTEWSRGSQQALNELMPLVYAELHRIASRYMARQSLGHTLQTTALINEAYFRLVGGRVHQCEDRTHFFRIAAQSMRHVLVDHARHQLAAKRGGEKLDLALDEAILLSTERLASIVALDDALSDLAKLNPRQASVVEMKYFAGLTVEETASILDISPETVMREWRAARAWLYLQLTGSDGPSPVSK